MEKLQVDTPALNKQKSAIPEEWEYLSSKVTTSKYSECLIIKQQHKDTQLEAPVFLVEDTSQY